MERDEGEGVREDGREYKGDRSEIINEGTSCVPGTNSCRKEIFLASYCLFCPS